MKRIDPFYVVNNEMNATPWLLSPSRSKLLYANILCEFWYGINRAGFLNYGAGIIGYSLPGYDNYRQIIYELVRNYQESDQELTVGDISLKKSNFKVIDMCNDTQQEREFKDRYSFINWDRTDLYIKGFNEEAVNLIFDQEDRVG